MGKYICVRCRYNYHGFCRIKKIDRLKQNNIQKCDKYKKDKAFCNIRTLRVRRIGGK